MRILGTVIGTLVVLAAIGLIVVYGGFYNVAASSPHAALTRWLFHATMEHSVERQAKQIEAPTFDQATVNEGAGHYSTMCEGCHGAPGVKPGEAAKGMRPQPPDLKDAAKHWSAAQLFWIVKHGVKMTGMPAWGAVDEDNELWSVVAFVKSLPNTSPQQYQVLKAQYGGEHERESGDSHADRGHSEAESHSG